MLVSEADCAEKHVSPIQPGRVVLNRISWHEENRGGQGIMPFHAQDIAKDLSKNGTSKRRYRQVRLVEVPEKFIKSWLSAIRRKAKLNTLLAHYEAMSQTGPLYATLRCTHFVEAQKLIGEGNRRYMDKPDGTRLQLKEHDKEGRMIQEQGVNAICLLYTSPSPRDS